MPEIGNSSVFSQTDSSNNTSTDPGWPEGMAPSRVNDAARALQGAITRDWNWKGPTVTSAGTNTVTLTYSVAPAAYYTGMVFTFLAGGTNTGATTLNVNSLGAKNVYNFNQACVGGEIVSGEIVKVGYDGTQFQIISVTRGAAKQMWFPPFSLTDGASISWDCDVAQVATVTLGGNRTLSNPSNVKSGATYLLHVVQDGTGSRTLSYGANFDFGASGSPTLTTTASKTDILSFVGGASSKMRFIGIAKGFT